MSATVAAIVLFESFWLTNHRGLNPLFFIPILDLCSDSAIKECVDWPVQTMPTDPRKNANLSSTPHRLPAQENSDWNKQTSSISYFFYPFLSATDRFISARLLMFNAIRRVSVGGSEGATLIKTNFMLCLRDIDHSGLIQFSSNTVLNVKSITAASKCSKRNQETQHIASQ